MPDATGTATSPDLIPTYNTAVDPPSGKGLNTVVAAIQTALTNSYIRKPASIVANEVPVWNGSTWIRSSATRIINGPTALPNITTSTIAGGPPSSPSDGDIWIATSIGGQGERWQFQYDVSEITYKWKFIGGAPLQANGTFTPNGTSTWTGLSNMTMTRTGLYLVESAAFGQVSAAGSGTFELGLGLGGAINSTTSITSALASTYFALPGQPLEIIPSAGQILSLMYWANQTGTASGSSYGWTVRPIKVA